MIIYSPFAVGAISGFGVPTAGTSGQILQKVNATNYNTQWISQPTPVYLSVNKSAVQSIDNNVETTVTNWDGIQYINNYPSSWVSLTGIFTVPVAGIYEISLRTCLASNTPATTEREFAPLITVNGTIHGMGGYYTTSTGTAPTPIVEAKVIMQLSVGDLVRPRIYHNLGAAINTFAGRNWFSIRQLPGKITV